jgi:hypothetical protein
MSGSSGGGGGGSWDPPPTRCELLVIDTQLSSPKAAVIASISVGDILDVALRPHDGGVLVVVLHNEEVAGGLASPNLPRLRECIEGGTQYAAEVNAINGAQVKVRVSAVV